MDEFSKKIGKLLWRSKLILIFQVFALFIFFSFVLPVLIEILNTTDSEAAGWGYLIFMPLFVIPQMVFFIICSILGFINSTRFFRRKIYKIVPIIVFSFSILFLVFIVSGIVLLKHVQTINKAGFQNL